MSIRAIETVYNGYRFRSRLEARWAVFFDELAIAYEYEPQGYEVGKGGRAYLPDFYLPETKTWVEVKGDPAALDPQLLGWATDWDTSLPGLHDSMGTRRGLLLLGAIPHRPPEGYDIIHPILQHCEGTVLKDAWFTWGEVVVQKGGSSWVADGFYELDDGFMAEVRRLHPGVYGYPCYAEAYRHVRDAYDTARQARFEHGETPRARRA